jgi:hypothetical protein
MTPSDVPPCQETSGFLFAHLCGRPSVFSCARCAKRICVQHARPQPPEAFICVTCARTAGDRRSDSDTDIEDDRDDPYFYAEDYRSRAGFTDTSDPRDFQEGDRAAEADEAGEDWENDTGGS